MVELDKMSEEILPFKIICPFCNSAYTAKMILDLEEITCSEETGNFSTTHLKIYCNNCKRLVYTKQEF